MSDTLHQQIMNLPHKAPDEIMTPTERMGYGAGHRDARHAAAELVATALALRDAEVQRLREDAERYRWLRSWMGRQSEAPEMLYSEPESPEELDAAIDAARAALKEQQ